MRGLAAAVSGSVGGGGDCPPNGSGVRAFAVGGGG